jgi:hypothetical protein
MTYELHISRGFAPDEKPITNAQWSAVIEGDRTLVVQAEEWTEYRDPKTKTLETAHAVRWTEHPSDGAAFFLVSGEIVCRDADDEALEKAREIAAKLGARVFGGDYWPL